MSMPYNIRNIRTLLTEGFTDEDLRRLCYDIPELRPIYDQLAQNIGKAKIIDYLIEYSDRKLQIDTLLTVAKEYNPAMYEKCQPYYDVTTSLPNSSEVSERDLKADSFSPDDKNALQNVVAVGEKNMQIHSQGDVAIHGSVIDKRSGGIFISNNDSGYQPKQGAHNQSAALRLCLGVIIAVVIGLGSNIIATYLQEQYDLISDTGRFLIVVIAFLLAIIFDIALLYKS